MPKYSDKYYLVNNASLLTNFITDLREGIQAVDKPSRKRPLVQMMVVPERAWYYSLDWKKTHSNFYDIGLPVFLGSTSLYKERSVDGDATVIRDTDAFLLVAYDVRNVDLVCNYLCKQLNCFTTDCYIEQGSYYRIFVRVPLKTLFYLVEKENNDKSFVPAVVLVNGNPLTWDKKFIEFYKTHLYWYKLPSVSHFDIRCVKKPKKTINSEDDLPLFELSFTLKKTAVYRQNSLDYAIRNTLHNGNGVVVLRLDVAVDEVKILLQTTMLAYLWFINNK